MSDRVANGFLQDISVEMIVELGRRRTTIRDLAALDRDDIIELDREPNDLVELVVSGRVFARAELVTAGDKVSLRIVDLGGAEQARKAG
jgi:flagellar motor switch protein FliN/FliY